MNQTSFSTAIEHFFTRTNSPIVLDPSETFDASADISGDITIENLQPISDRLFDTIAATIDRTEAGSIPLLNLIKLRAQFYEAKDKLITLEQKEHQDVADLKSTTSWHERSKFVRIFVNSDAGERLDEEVAEAKEVSTTKNHFFEELEDLESVINFRIMTIGEQSSVEYKNLVEQWRTIRQLHADAEKSIAHVKSAYANLPSSSRCWKCGSHSNNDSSRSRNQLSAANNQLNNQMSTLKPWYNQLTAQVEETIDAARASLKL